MTLAIIIVLVFIIILLGIKIQFLLIKVEVSERFIDYLSSFYKAINEAFSVYKDANSDNKDTTERVKIEAVKTILEICEETNKVNKEIDEFLNK